MSRVCASGWMLLLLLLGNVTKAGDEVERKPDSTTVQSDWPAKLQFLYKGDAKAAHAIIEDLIALPPDEGLRLVTQAWLKISPEMRRQIIQSWFRPIAGTGRQHARMVNVLDLGMRDASPKVQEDSLFLLRQITLLDFTNDLPAYEAWYRENSDKQGGTIVMESVSRFVRDAARADQTERLRLAGSLRWSLMFTMFPATLEVARQADLPKTFARWITEWARPDASRPEVEAANNTLGALRRLCDKLPFDEAELRRFVTPILKSSAPDQIKGGVLVLLEGRKYPWATELALNALQIPSGGKGDPSALVWSASSVLASINDPKTIPAMIAAIEADNTYTTVYGVGYFGLGKMTGVKYDKTHNGAWWRAWWNQNQQRYATANGSTPKLADRGEQIAQKETADSATDDGTAVQENRVDGDEKKRYFLIGSVDLPKAPPAGRPLLVVLPGGDGGLNFSNWMKTIDREALSEEWLVAQVVAPRWSDSQASRLVWPTATNSHPAAKFTTEKLIESVLADVQKKAKVDPARIYVMGWSSGGPPCYALLLQKDSPFRGGLIAMSIFKPAKEEAMRRGAGKRFYLLQSPDDRVTPFRFTEDAAKRLEAVGASVKLQTYEGGHGWRDDPLEQIRQGIKWLEETDSGS